MHTNDHDLYVAARQLTPALLDHYPVISATTGGSSYVALRTDKRMGGLYHRGVAELTQLWLGELSDVCLTTRDTAVGIT